MSLFDCMVFSGRMWPSAYLSFLLTTATLANPAYAQLTPDDTLGDEASTVTPDVLVQGDFVDLIEGGAVR
ncbi:MAG: hypothetical protein F6K42_37195, partial [Leptolyngbya sp. SIO1D8]|nr:hypothetical protein [Leptolyngbya sp. SIO1D8]